MQYASSVREMLHILEYTCSSLVLRMYNVVSSMLQSFGILVGKRWNDLYCCYRERFSCKVSKTSDQPAALSKRILESS